MQETFDDALEPSEPGGTTPNGRWQIGRKHFWSGRGRPLYRRATMFDILIHSTAAELPSEMVSTAQQGGLENLIDGFAVDPSLTVMDAAIDKAASHFVIVPPHHDDYSIRVQHGSLLEPGFWESLRDYFGKGDGDALNVVAEYENIAPSARHPPVNGIACRKSSSLPFNEPQFELLRRICNEHFVRFHLTTGRLQKRQKIEPVLGAGLPTDWKSDRAACQVMLLFDSTMDADERLHHYTMLDDLTVEEVERRRASRPPELVVSTRTRVGNNYMTFISERKVGDHPEAFGAAARRIRDHAEGVGRLFVTLPRFNRLCARWPSRSRDEWENTIRAILLEQPVAEIIWLAFRDWRDPDGGSICPEGMAPAILHRGRNPLSAALHRANAGTDRQSLLNYLWRQYFQVHDDTPRSRRKSVALCREVLTGLLHVSEKVLGEPPHLSQEQSNALPGGSPDKSAPHPTPEQSHRYLGVIPGGAPDPMPPKATPHGEPGGAPSGYNNPRD